MYSCYQPCIHAIPCSHAFKVQEMQAGHKLNIHVSCYQAFINATISDAKQKKHVFFYKKTCLFFKKPSSKKNCFLCFFIIIYNLTGKCFLILWSAYSCYIQVVKHYIQYVNCIFIDSETNYLMNYNTNLHCNIKLHNYNL